VHWLRDVWNYLFDLYVWVFWIGVVLFAWATVAQLTTANLDVREIDAEHFRNREGMRIATALLSAVAVPIAVAWFHYGVPPVTTHLLLGVDLFYPAEFVVGVFTLIACAMLRRRLHRAKSPLRAFPFVIGLFIVNALFFSFALVWAVRDAYAAFNKSIHPQPLTPIGRCEADKDSIVIVHLSDLHVTDQAHTRDGKMPGNGRLVRLLTDIARRASPSYLVISGDLTDQGEVTHWRLLEGVFATMSRIPRTIVAPGNHDLNQFFGVDPEWNELDKIKDASVIMDTQKMPRMGRFLTFQSHFLPELTNYTGHTLADVLGNMPSTATLQKFPKERDECYERCRSWAVGSELQSGTDLGCWNKCTKDWRTIRFVYLYDLEESFPWKYVDPSGRVAFFSLASTISRTTSVGENAIGFLPDEQIDRLKTGLSKLPESTRLIVVTLHHPLSVMGPKLRMPSLSVQKLLHPRRFRDEVYNSDLFLSVFLRNDFKQADKLNYALSSELGKRPNTSAIVMFGHRHKRSLSFINRVIYEEAPNVATEEPTDFGYYLIGLRDNDTSVAWCQVDQR
jgi:small basic protein